MNQNKPAEMLCQRLLQQLLVNYFQAILHRHLNSLFHLLYSKPDRHSKLSCVKTKQNKINQIIVVKIDTTKLGMKTNDK